jgi:hypothetical protein
MLFYRYFPARAPVVRPRASVDQPTPHAPLRAAAAVPAAAAALWRPALPAPVRAAPSFFLFQTARRLSAASSARRAARAKPRASRCAAALLRQLRFASPSLASRAKLQNRPPSLSAVLQLDRRRRAPVQPAPSRAPPSTAALLRRPSCCSRSAAPRLLWRRGSLRLAAAAPRRPFLLLLRGSAAPRLRGRPAGHLRPLKGARDPQARR